MHLVIHPKSHTDVGKPGSLLYGREPPRLPPPLRGLSTGHGVAFSRWRRHQGQEAFGDAGPTHLLLCQITPDFGGVRRPFFLSALTAISARKPVVAARGQRRAHSVDDRQETGANTQIR